MEWIHNRKTWWCIKLQKESLDVISHGGNLWFLGNSRGLTSCQTLRNSDLRTWKVLFPKTSAETHRRDLIREMKVWWPLGDVLWQVKPRPTTNQTGMIHSCRLMQLSRLFLKICFDVNRIAFVRLKSIQAKSNLKLFFFVGFLPCNWKLSKNLRNDCEGSFSSAFSRVTRTFSPSSWCGKKTFVFAQLRQEVKLSLEREKEKKLYKVFRLTPRSFSCLLFRWVQVKNVIFLASSCSLSKPPIPPPLCSCYTIPK